jgi:hypothetical protein
VKKWIVLPAAVFVWFALLWATPGRYAQSDSESPSSLLPGTIQRVSLNSSGAEAHGDSRLPAMTADGRFIVFESDANDLVAGDSNNVSDIFVHDRSNGQTIRVSIRSDGQQGNFGSYSPAISDDGRIVVFHSSANNLVDSDSNNVADIFAHDLWAHQTTRISVSGTGVQANDVSYDPVISADGRYVAYWSYAKNLIPVDGNNTADVFVVDRSNGFVERVSVDANEVEANGPSMHPSISDDGRRIAFESTASNLVTGDGFGYKDIFIRNLNTSNTERISLNFTDGEANGDSFSAAISGDGLQVAYVSFADNVVVEDNNDLPDVFIRDRVAATNIIASVSFTGVQANDWDLFMAPALSQDGRFIVFRSPADNLVNNDHNESADIFIRDRLTGIIGRLSTTSTGVEGNDSSREPVVSFDGRYVAFQSTADNLVPNDDNGVRDIFVFDRYAAPPATATPTPTNTPILPTNTPTPTATPTPAAVLTINHPIGAPGSYFYVQGSDFTPNQNAILSINNVVLPGVIPVNAAGDLTFQLTTSNASAGDYFLTVLSSPSTDTITFRLDPSTPIWPQTGSGPIFDVPAGIALNDRLYLSFTRRD